MEGVLTRKTKALSGGVADSWQDGSVLTSAGLGLFLAGVSVVTGSGGAAVLASLAIPVVELLNTSIEHTVNATGVYNDTTRKAKDAGALAVAIMTIIAILFVVVGIIAWVRRGDTMSQNLRAIVY
jgi:diacylglycerol kinase